MSDSGPREPQDKILRRSVLRQEAERLREVGKTIVFTNGCFDIVHIGHIRHLRDARALGDCLIVGLNSDRAVREYKGDPRPLVPELGRAELLAALEFVDYVTIFDELTATNLLLALKPQIYAKREDYGAEMIPELPALESYGGKMVRIGVTQDRSTTNLITKILDVHGAPVENAKS
jgi:D-glycero-beta-D-manno-heptose 1-phosphate adenylyltransferase